MEISRMNGFLKHFRYIYIMVIASPLYRVQRFFEKKKKKTVLARVYWALIYCTPIIKP